MSRTINALLVALASTAACNTVETLPELQYVFCPTHAAHERDPLLVEDMRTAALWLEAEGWGELTVVEAGDDACNSKVKFGDLANQPKSVQARASASGITLRESKWDRWVKEGYSVDILAHEMGHILGADHTDSGIMASHLHASPMIEGTR